MSSPFKIVALCGLISFLPLLGCQQSVEEPKPEVSAPAGEVSTLPVPEVPPDPVIVVVNGEEIRQSDLIRHAASCPSRGRDGTRGVCQRGRAGVSIRRGSSRGRRESRSATGPSWGQPATVEKRSRAAIECAKGRELENDGSGPGV